MPNNAPLRKTIPLRSRKILKKSLGNALTVLLVGGAFTLIGKLLLENGIIIVPDGYEHTAELVILMWFGFLLVLMFWRMLYQYVYFLNYFYDCDELNMTIRKGIVTKREVILPFKRITDVYVDQDIWDVALGLYDVHISTPTQESGRFAHIDGVDRDGAHKLRALILEKINNQKAA